MAAGTVASPKLGAVLTGAPYRSADVVHPADRVLSRAPAQLGNKLRRLSSPWRPARIAVFPAVPVGQLARHPPTRLPARKLGVG